MAKKLLKTIKRIPCLFGFHSWRESKEMPEKVCKKCHQRRPTFI
jgi:hypothetical protein